MTDDVVKRFKAAGPRFAFGPRNLALIASVADIGPRLAQNAAARELVAELMAETTRRKLADCPTAMMLRAALELNGIPIRFVPLEKLGLSFPKGEN